MPFLDRHWWLRIPIALLPLGAAIFIVADVLCDPSGASEPPFGTSCAGVAALSLLVFAYVFMRRIGPARDRAGHRRAAIAGNRDCITIADGADVLAETALPRVPFVVAFPLTRWDEPALARLRVVLSAMLFAILVGLTYVLDSQRSRTVPMAISYVLFFILAGVTHLWSSLVIRPYVRTYRSPRSIIADAMGIRWQAIVGRERAIRWDEMRLLEVTSFNATPFTSNQTTMRRRYTLYTRDSAIWWTDPGLLHLPPSGPYTQLLALIRARTGLEPRTFESGALGATRVLATAFVPQAQAPHIEDTVTYMLPVPLPSRRERLIVGIFGFIITSVAILAVIWVFSFFGVFTLPPFLHYTAEWLYILAVLFLLFGSMIGPSMFLWALRATPRRHLRQKGGIRANRIGLWGYPTPNARSIAWADIADIQCEISGTTKEYTVLSAVEDYTITWSDASTHRYPPAELVSARGYTAISSDELVALVMHMTGKPLMSRDSQPSVTGATHAVS